MSNILKNGIWRAKEVPSFLTEVNPNHNLARGLVSFWTPGTTLNDLAPTGNNLLAYSGAQRNIGILGPAADSTQASSGLYIPNMSSSLMLTTGTYILRCTFFGAAVGGSMWIGSNYNEPYTGPYVGVDLGFSGSNDGTVYWNDGTTIGVGNGITCTPGEYLWVMAWTGGAGYTGSYFATNFYPGSVQTDNGSFPVPSFTSTSYFNIGGDSNDSTRNSDLLTYCAGVWNRVLTPNEIAQIVNEPFGVLRQKIKRKIYVIGSANPPVGKHNRKVQAVKRASYF